MDKIDWHWKKRFNEAASNFENDADIGLWTDQGFERRFVTFFQVFQENYNTIDKRKKILDIGCGSGAYTRQLTNIGHDVVGIDYSENVIKKAIDKSKQMNNKHYIIGSLPFLPFKENSFDIAICIGVFQHIPDEYLAITDIIRVLKENKGVLILITLNSLSIRTFVKETLTNFLIRNKNKAELHARKFNPFKFKQILIDKGFDNVKISGIFIFPKVLIPLERLFEERNVLQMLDRMPHLSLLVAHAFLVTAKKQQNNI